MRRGSYIESVHCVIACVTRADGELLHAIGNVDISYPIRSLAKPFIARELVRSGAVETYGLEDVEIALSAGSHDGEERHIQAVRAFLARIGLDESALCCGPALENQVVVGPPIANNCSGKHAAVLAMCRKLGLSTEGYLSPNHPIQQRLLPELFAAFSCEALNTPLAVDGCGMPIFGASLRQIATAYARFGSAGDAASKCVRAAMAAQPGYVGGWNGNINTNIISWSDGEILAKIGAEGLHGDTISDKGLGIAVKVLDGNSRALPPILAQLFLESIDNVPISRQHLAALAAPRIFNAAGHCVGEARSAGEALPEVESRCVLSSSTVEAL